MQLGALTRPSPCTPSPTPHSFDLRRLRSHPPALLKSRIPSLSSTLSLSSTSPSHQNSRWTLLPAPSCIVSDNQGLVEDTPAEVAVEIAGNGASISQLPTEDHAAEEEEEEEERTITVSKKREDLANKSIWDQIKEIVMFSGPATGLWICAPLMSLISTAVIGQGSSTELAALGLSMLPLVAVVHTNECRN